MVKGESASIMDCFESLEDPRIDRAKRHNLLGIVTIAICASICGADNWVHIELFGESKEEWSWTFPLSRQGASSGVAPRHPLPRHPRFHGGRLFGDVFSRLDPARFQSCFMEWTQAVAQLVPGEVAAIDGKTMRRSHDRTGGKKALHPVSSTGQALEKGHGRIEKRECWVITDPECLDYLQTGKQWPCLKSVAKVAGRRDTGQGAVSQPRYYISSLDASAHRLLSVIRSHRSIENSLHWTLDATFREDRRRGRKTWASCGRLPTICSRGRPA